MGPVVCCFDMKSMRAFVRGLVAYQIGVSPTAIGGGAKLDRDLRLTPLGLVTVALDVEDLTGIRVAPEKLGTVETVDQLIELFERALRSERSADARWRARTVARLAG